MASFHVAPSLNHHASLEVGLAKFQRDARAAKSGPAPSVLRGRCSTWSTSVSFCVAGAVLGAPSTQTIYTTSSNTTSSTHTHHLHNIINVTSPTQHHQHNLINTSPPIKHHLHNTIYTTPSTRHHLHYIIKHTA